jgi:pSer/pThr/pTyr-binding forkhead associated (FHA) protein
MPFRIAPLINGTAPTILLHRPVLLVGRHLECDVRIESSKISRRHCCLALAYDRVVIRDLGSKNGVRVNGRMVEESRLDCGDELAIGPFLFRVDFEAEKPDSGVAPHAQPAVLGRPPGLNLAASQFQSAGGGPYSSRPNSEDDLIPLDDV